MTVLIHKHTGKRVSADDYIPDTKIIYMSTPNSKIDRIVVRPKGEVPRVAKPEEYGCYISRSAGQ